MYIKNAKKQNIFLLILFEILLILKQIKCLQNKKYNTYQKVNMSKFSWIQIQDRLL